MQKKESGMGRRKQNKIKSEDAPQKGTRATGTKPLHLHRVAGILAILIGSLTLVLYLPALQNGFIDGWDDGAYVSNNLHIQSLDWKFFRWALLDYKYFLWHPLTWISHAIDYAIWGLNPFGHHLTSIILHAINTGVVLFLTIWFLDVVNDLRQRAGDVEVMDRRSMILTGCVTGLLFGIHPLHVESVAWIAERKDLLYSFFFLLSLMSYTGYVQERSKVAEPVRFYVNRKYFFALFLFSLALCSKPMAVTLPVILLLLDWYPFKRMTSFRSAVGLCIEKLPFLLLSLGVSVVTILSQQATGGLRSLDEASVTVRVLVAFKGLVFYLVNIFLPFNLLPFYPYPKDASITNSSYLATIFLVCFITAGCLLVARKKPLWVTCWLFFIISIFPVLGFLQAGNQFIADRFMYLPSLGFFVLMGLGISSAWKESDVLAARFRWGKPLMVVILVTLLVTLSGLTIKQIGIWRDGISLWTYILELKPLQYPEVYFSRGEEFVARGNIDKGLEDYNTAIAVDPKYDSAYINKGVILMTRGELDNAIKEFEMVIKINPQSADAYTNRGSAYYRKGNLEQALTDYSMAIAMDATLGATYINRALVYKERDDFGKAITDFTTAISLNPDLVKPYLIRGDLYMKTGDVERAVKDYEKACSLGDKSGCEKAFFPFQGQ